MKKILFVQTTLEPPGGKSAVAVWMLEALKKEYAISILTWKPPDLREIDRFYGTSLKSSELIVHYINPLLRAFISLDPDPESFQKTSYLMRVCKRIKDEYDILISADDEIDFGRKGIQYFHYPYLHKKIWQGVDSPRYEKLKGILKGTLRPWMLISGFSLNRMKNNLALVNSDWTGMKASEFYGIETRTVYPPVPGNFLEVPWEEKDEGFVCIGRICPGKRFETVIEILSAVKSKIRNVHLNIIGSLGTKKEDRNYYQDLIRLVQENSSWVSLHENLSREELLRFIASQRYGIHANIDEHFGIAVAEMLKAGCIVFAHNSGGQVEILGKDERLVYETEKEAVEKIVYVMNNSEVQTSILSFLNPRKELFSTEKFINNIREVVKQFS